MLVSILCASIAGGAALLAALAQYGAAVRAKKHDEVRYLYARQSASRAAVVVPESMQDRIIREEGWDKIGGVPIGALCNANGLDEIDAVYRRALGMEPPEKAPEVVVKAELIATRVPVQAVLPQYSCRHCGVALTSAAKTLECEACLADSDHYIAIPPTHHSWDEPHHPHNCPQCAENWTLRQKFEYGKLAISMGVPLAVVQRDQHTVPIYDPEDGKLLGGVLDTGLDHEDRWKLYDSAEMPSTVARINPRAIVKNE